MRAIQFTCGVALGTALALVWVAFRHDPSTRAPPPLRRRLADEDCVAGAGWTGFKRAERYAALQHVDADNANHKRPGDVYASWRGPADAWVLGTNGTFDGGENALIPEACAELDVAVVNEDRCVLVSRQDEPGAVWNSNLQPDFNVSICDSFDASSSAVLRELDESNRFVQKSAESTSI